MDIQKNKPTLKPLLAELADQSQEREFRQSALDIDIRHGQRLLVIISLVLTVFLLFEASSLQTNRAILETAFARLSVIVAGMILARALMYWRSVPMLDGILILYVVIFSIGNTFLNLSVAGEIHDDHWLAIPAGGYLIAILGVYVATPIRFSLQIVGSIIFTLAYFVLVAVWPIESNINSLFVALLFSAAHAIGITAAYRTHELRRAQWCNLEQEKKISEKLKSEIEQRGLLETQLRTQANTDPLTGIYNRRLLFKAGEDIFNQARRSDRSLGMILLDIDHFKRINDNYGHAAGDEVLKSVVGTIGGNLREPDLFYRYGGEEFAVLLPETNLAGACNIAERIRKAVSSMTIKIEEKSEHMTISIGVTVVKKGDEALDALILRADDALYTAKEKGRDMFVSSV